MVMPRSRSIGLESSTCASISRACRPPQSWMMRSARVDLPWSTWAMIEKLRMCCIEPGCVRRRVRCAMDVAINTALSHAIRGHRPRSALHGTRWDRGAMLIAPRLRLLPAVDARRHRHELGCAATAHKQHHRLPGPDLPEFTVERGRGADHDVADPQHHVARLQARIARGEAFDPGDSDAFVRLEAQLPAVVAVQRLPDQAERIGRVSSWRWPVRHVGGDAVVELAEHHVDIQALVAAQHAELGARARRHRTDQWRQVAGIIDGNAVEGADDVADFDPGLLRRAPLHDRGHQCAARVLQAKPLGLLVVDLLHLHADLAATDLAGGLELLHGAHRGIDRDRETHAHVAAGITEDLRVDADHLAARVEQWTTGIAAIDRDIGLDEGYVAL